MPVSDILTVSRCDDIDLRSVSVDFKVQPQFSRSTHFPKAYWMLVILPLHNQF